MSTVSAPPARMNHIVALDEERDRLFVFGGLATGGTCGISVDTYRLSFAGAPPSTWNGVSSSLFPEGGWFATGAVDEANDRLVVHGGVFGCRFPNHPSGSPYDGTWALDLVEPHEWRRLSPPGLGPGSAGDGTYDPVRRRLLVATAGVGLSEMPLDPGSEAWRVIAPRGERPLFGNPLAFDYDPGRDRFVLVSGLGQVRYLLPTRAAEPSPVPASARTVPGAAEASMAPPLTLVVLTNPVRGGTLALNLGLAGEDAGRLELVDVRGRIVASERIASGTRRHETRALASQPSGVYFARLIQDDCKVVRKFVLTR